MRSSRNLRRIVIATAGAAAIATTWSAGPAWAAGATQVNPIGAHAKVQNIGNVTVAISFLSGSCTNLSATAQVPTSGNPDASGPVSLSAPAPAISGCTAPFETVTVTTSGTWTVAAQYGSTITGSLTVPQNGVVVKLAGLFNCTITGAPTGPVTGSGTVTNGTNSTTNPTTITASATVPISVGSGCPSVSSATLSGKFGLYDTDNTSVPITVTS